MAVYSYTPYLKNAKPNKTAPNRCLQCLPKYFCSNDKLYFNYMDMPLCLSAILHGKSTLMTSTADEALPVQSNLS